MSTTRSASATAAPLGALLSLFLLVLAFPSVAATVFVNAGTTGSVHDGLTWPSAFSTVQAGVDAASTGDDVWVAKGVYAESISIAKTVNLYGGFTGNETALTQRNWQANPTVLDGGGGASVITVSLPATAMIDGLTIRNTNRLTGVGVALNGTSGKLLNCTVLHHGTAVSAAGTASTVENCAIADAPVGVSSDMGSPVIDGNILTGCATAVAAGGGSATVYNNTIVNNGTGVESAIILRGNIIAWNATGVASYSTSNLPANNCLYQNGSDWGSNTSQTGLNGNIAVDPKLANPSVGNCRLLTGSPCIDAGYAVTLPLSIDIYGQTRVQGKKIDIGAAEYGAAPQTISPVTIRVSPNGDDANDGLSWAAPKRTFQAAVDSALGAGGEVWARKGVYTDSVVVYFTMPLYGGFAGDETSRSQRHGAASVLIGDSGVATVSVFAEVSPVTVDGISSRGGYSGVECDGGATVISNCFLSGCTDGVSVYADAPTIVNDTIVDNTHGVYCNTGSPTVANTIVALNQSGVYQDPDGTSTPALSHTCVFGNGTNFDGTADQSGSNGNITADPLLASGTYGDLHIQPGSPCIDAGDDTVAPSGADIDGQSRTQGAHVDIGADESDGVSRSVTPMVVWVDGATGLDANDGSTHDLAKKTVQAAEDAVAPSGGEVWVTQGSYAGNIQARPFVYLYGGFSGAEVNRTGRNLPGSVTTLSGDSSNATVSFDGGYTSSGIDGFTVESPFTAIECTSASPTIAHNSLLNAPSGVDATDASPLVEFNTVSGSSYGLSFEGGAPKILNNVLKANYSAGIACWDGNSTIRNNAVLGSGENGVYLVGGTSSLVGNTIMGGATALSASDGAVVTAANDILAYNLTGLEMGASPTQVTLGHCDLYHNNAQVVGTTDPSGTNGNISIDPMFAAPAYGDVHLQPASALIGAGDASAVLPGEVDMDGAARSDGGKVEIGADEADGVARTISPAVIRVNANTGSDANDGSQWTSAKQTVQAGIDAASAVGGEVWVAGGTYAQPVRLKPFAYVYGGFNGTETDRTAHLPVAGATVLDGTSIPTMVKARGGYTFSALDGVTLANGNLGVSALGSALTISRCQITSNNAALSDTGGAVVFSRNTLSGNGGAANFAVSSSGGNSSITGNVFFNNGTGTSTSAGAISIDSGTQVIAGNLIVGSPVAVYTAGSGSVVNNTIYGGRYGLYVYGPSGSAAGTMLFANNIVASTGTTGVYRTGSAIFVTALNNDVFNCPALYSGVTNPTGTNGNISADPLFRPAGNYRLTAASPAIDAGSDLSAIAGLADLDGKTRPQGAHLDMGAYEYTASTLTLADAARALQIAGGISSALANDIVKLDLSNDGKVNLGDVVRVLRNAVGVDQ